MVQFYVFYVFKLSTVCRFKPLFNRSEQRGSLVLVAVKLFEAIKCVIKKKKTLLRKEVQNTEKIIESISFGFLGFF